ncbi:biotin synthase [Saccharomonospora amisosensis]|uniref:Biotin synthase n=1 Tax=Saccharomonospora amisosensis TaxID=1128677 RepID=A0A7X5URR8_9PSEU|nr:radical SAM protein [Saccharomonospora amisosensis]NIJ13008.1 biotin synthase [Saccharomonospora amisosensis]
MGRQLPVLPSPAPAAAEQNSPEWVRISMASAIALRFRSGRFSRDFDFGGINLLLNYDEGCRSDCGYCGLARTRPGDYNDKSFIRVEWPLVRTDDLVSRMVEHEEKLTRLCISMVTHGHAYADTCDITERIVAGVRTPLSILVAPPTLNRERLERFKALGVDMIGIGLDAVTEELFRNLRTNVPAGRLSWEKYWEIVTDSREIFGPWKVNVHTLVGLGEADEDLIRLFVQLREREIFAYLFCFNPEPDSRMADHPKSPIRRWRRVQLAKHLVESEGYGLDAFRFDSEGNLLHIDGGQDRLESVVDTGIPFVTNGCPGENGEPGCTRPYGSYRPSEPFRDYPFVPTADDLAEIRQQLRLDDVLQ